MSLAKPRMAAIKREIYRRDPDRHKQRVRSWKARNHEATLAHSKVATAIKSGRLQRKPCEMCGNPTRKVQGHHEDYSKPLEVTWLCAECHRAMKHGRGIRRPDPQPLPPNPSRFHLTRTPKGWVKKINGKTTWVCSVSAAPTVEAADRIYLLKFGVAV